MSGIDDNPTDLDELERLALLAIARLLRDQEPQDDVFRQMEELTQDLLSTQPDESDDAERGPPREEPTRTTAQDDKTVADFEKALWNHYKLTGVLVPDELLQECRRRLYNTHGSISEQKAQTQLNILGEIHRYRKQRSISFASEQPTGLWADAQKVNPTQSMRSKGNRFWAVIIGNDDYPGSPLGGAINDAHLVTDFITTYLNVPYNHISLLKNAGRDTIVNALYDLRDNPDIQRGDNILIHYSGHGSSYSAADYFLTPGAKVGSVEAICPIDRSGYTVPDICDRELNSIVREIGFCKGPNITLFLDCCHSGGAMRSLGDTVRYIPPVTGTEALCLMFDTAEQHPRRGGGSQITSTTWEADTSSFVQLAACQDFQLAEETNVDQDDGHANVPRLFASTVARPSPRHGRFTWALIWILKSSLGVNATYASVINAMGVLGPMQVPVVVGSRKNSRLWFE